MTAFKDIISTAVACVAAILVIALLLLSTRFGKITGSLPKTDTYTTYRRRAGIVVRLN